MNWLTIAGLAIGGALLLEGAVWALFPDAMRDAYTRMMETSRDQLQLFGMVSAALGVLTVVMVMRSIA